MRSAFSSGPSTGKRRPKLAFTTASTVSASQTPVSTRWIASRHSAICRRLPIEPDTSLRTCTGVWPRLVCSVIIASITAGCVHSVPMISTSGTRKGGFHQWVASARPRWARSRMIGVTLITDVLVASTVLSRTSGSMRANNACLRARSSAIASTTRSAPATVASMPARTAMRSSAAASWSSAARLAATLAWTLSRTLALSSVIVTAWWLRANTCAIPCPISPAPMMATFMSRPPGSAWFGVPILSRAGYAARWSTNFRHRYEPSRTLALFSHS